MWALPAPYHARWLPSHAAMAARHAASAALYRRPVIASLQVLSDSTDRLRAWRVTILRGDASVTTVTVGALDPVAAAASPGRAKSGIAGKRTLGAPVTTSSGGPGRSSVSRPSAPGA